MVEGWRGTRAGLTDEQKESLRASLPGLGQFPAFEAPPLLPPHLLPVWDAWGPESQLGPTATIKMGGGGMAGVYGSVRDHRASLYPARLAWLTENGYDTPDDRATLLYLWGELDREQIRADHEALAAAIKRSTEK